MIKAFTIFAGVCLVALIVGGIIFYRAMKKGMGIRN